MPNLIGILPIIRNTVNIVPRVFVKKLYNLKTFKSRSTKYRAQARHKYLQTAGLVYGIGIRFLVVLCHLYMILVICLW